LLYKSAWASHFFLDEEELVMKTSIPGRRIDVDGGWGMGDGAVGGKQANNQTRVLTDKNQLADYLTCQQFFRAAFTYNSLTWNRKWSEIVRDISFLGKALFTIIDNFTLGRIETLKIKENKRTIESRVIHPTIVLYALARYDIALTAFSPQELAELSDKSRYIQYSR
jgi:hypothetical protein